MCNKIQCPVCPDPNFFAPDPMEAANPPPQQPTMVTQQHQGPKEELISTSVTQEDEDEDEDEDEEKVMVQTMAGDSPSHHHQQTSVGGADLCEVAGVVDLYEARRARSKQSSVYMGVQPTRNAAQHAPFFQSLVTNRRNAVPLRFLPSDTGVSRRLAEIEAMNQAQAQAETEPADAVAATPNHRQQQQQQEEEEEEEEEQQKHVNPFDQILMQPLGSPQSTSSNNALPQGDADGGAGSAPLPLPAGYVLVPDFLDFSLGDDDDSAELHHLLHLLKHGRRGGQRASSMEVVDPTATTTMTSHLQQQPSPPQHANSITQIPTQSTTCNTPLPQDDAVGDAGSASDSPGQKRKRDETDDDDDVTAQRIPPSPSVNGEYDDAMGAA